MGFTIAEELLKTSKIRERILIYHTGMTEISKPEGFLCGIHHLDGEGATPAFITALHTTPGLMLRLCADIIFFFFFAKVWLLLMYLGVKLLQDTWYCYPYGLYCVYHVGQINNRPELVSAPGTIHPTSR